MYRVPVNEENPNRRGLLAVKAEDDAAHLRERLAACYQELAETRAKIPVNMHQVSFKAPPAPTASDPLVRLFAAIAPRR